MSGRVAVGAAVRPHGLNGAVRVTPWLEDLSAYERIRDVVLQEEAERRLEVEFTRRGGKGAIVWKFKGVDSFEAAETLKGAVFLADRAVLRGPEEGVYYWEDFQDLDVADESGRLLGRVADLLGAGGSDVIVVRSAEGKEILLPAVREVILRREEGRLIVRPPRLSEKDEGEEGR